MGNVRLANFSLAGGVVNCSSMQAMPPGQTINCMLRKNVTEQEQAAAGSVLLSYPLTATPMGTVPTMESLPLQVYSANLRRLIAASPACGACRGCLASTNDFVRQSVTLTDPINLSKSFGVFCEQSMALRTSQACARVQAAIANSTLGNSGRRAAGLCLELQLCNRKLGASCAAQVNVSSTRVEVSAATLDVCTGKLIFRLADGRTAQACAQSPQA